MKNREEKPNFSIIIPHFNVPSYLERLLESAPCDRDDVEIIVVDDRSDEETEELKQIRLKYRKKGVNFYRNNHGKKGAGTCRNIGIKHAKGKWLIFADSDDHFTQDMYEIIEQKTESTADIIYFAPDSIDEDTGERSWRHEKDLEFITDYLNSKDHESEIRLRYEFAEPWSKLYKREFITDRNIRFSEVSASNDILFSAKAGYNAKKIEVSDEVFYVVTTRKNSMVTATDKRAVEVRVKEIIKRYRFLKSHLSRADMKTLNISGTDRIVGMIYGKAPTITIIRTAFTYILNGIRVIDFKKITLYELISISIKSKLNMNIKLHERNISKFGLIYDIEDQLIKRGLKKEFSLYSLKKMEGYYSGLKEDQYADELKEWYELNTKKKLDLENPKTFNEKMQWEKLYYKDPRKTTLCDKYLVKEWVRDIIGDTYVVEPLGVWDRFEDIDFNKLPDRFVLKANHGCGWNVIVRDKNRMDLRETRNKFRKWMQLNYGLTDSMQLQYKDIKPRIIAEEFLDNNTEDIDDYKFWCFDGKVEYIMFLTERSRHLKMAFFDRNWNIQDFTYNYPKYEGKIEKPDNLDEMIDISEKLSKDFPHVRVDLYRLNDGRIKFGEMTFTSYAGICRWDPEDTDVMLGRLYHLPRGL